MDSREQKLLAIIEEEIAGNRIILPSLPEVALRVRELTGQEECNYALLEKEIAKDAAIAARLLKVANSSAMHTGKPLTSVKQAITRLGLNLVRSLVTQLSILQLMHGCDDKERLQGFVASGMRISAICHSLAASHRHLDAEQAALAGLLHDIGKLPLRQFLSRREELRSNEALCRHIEQTLHPAVGGILLRHWRFPEELIEVAEKHEELQRDVAEQPDYTDLVIAANLLHYGMEKGRYAALQGERIPALEKSTAGREDGKLNADVEERMAMSLNLISA